MSTHLIDLFGPLLKARDEKQRRGQTTGIALANYKLSVAKFTEQIDPNSLVNQKRKLELDKAKAKQALDTKRDANVRRMIEATKGGSVALRWRATAKMTDETGDTWYRDKGTANITKQLETLEGLNQTKAAATLFNETLSTRLPGRPLYDVTSKYPAYDLIIQGTKFKVPQITYAKLGQKYGKKLADPEFFREVLFDEVGKGTLDNNGNPIVIMESKTDTTGEVTDFQRTAFVDAYSAAAKQLLSPKPKKRKQAVLVMANMLERIQKIDGTWIEPPPKDEKKPWYSLDVLMNFIFKVSDIQNAAVATSVAKLTDLLGPDAKNLQGIDLTDPNLTETVLKKVEQIQSKLKGGKQEPPKSVQADVDIAYDESDDTYWKRDDKGNEVKITQDEYEKIERGE